MLSVTSTSMFSLPALTVVAAAPGDVGSALGFVLAVTAQTIGGLGHEPTLFWVRQEAAVAETGALYGPAFGAFGIDLARVLLAHLRTPLDVLRAGLEGARCPALGAVIIETVAAIDFTTSRRLKLAAEKSGVPVVLLHHTEARTPSAASVRWRVSAAPSQKRDTPTFQVTALKHPTVFPGQRHVIEWNCAHRTFVETLSEPLVAVSGGRSMAA